jgi:pimeloyl-ACP methyl ester carboxylesterase
MGSGPDMPDVPGVRHRFVDAGGLRMHVAEAGEGEPLLLLHGWPQHWYLWRGVIPLLAPHARVICPDLRGFGWTDVPAGGYDKKTMARDVLALLDALGLERVRLTGHDWGGWIGFLLALRQPERVERLVVCNMPPPWPSRDPRAPLDVWRLSYQLALGAPKLGGALGRRIAERILRSTRALTDEEIAAFVDRLDGERELATRLLYRTFALREIPRLAGRYRASDLTVPTLILFGDRDQVMPLRTVRAAAAQSDAVELEPVPGASHFIVDERPQLVAERALDFFGLRAAGSAPDTPT